MAATIRRTRFKELAYTNFGKGLWRFVDLQGGACVGPQYPTRAELLADLERYASVYGCDDARPFEIPEHVGSMERLEEAPTEKSASGELSFRVWANQPSYAEQPRPWRCVAAFCYLTECLDYIASCQDAGAEVVFQSPADCRLVKATDRRMVYKGESNGQTI